MDSGVVSLEGLSAFVKEFERPARIRTVAVPRDGNSRLTPILAQIVIDPTSRARNARSWWYESCVFLEGELSIESLERCLLTPEGTIVAVDDIDLSVQFAPFQVSWQRSPRFAAFDEQVSDWPARIFQLSIEGQSNMFPPSGYLVGEGATPSFPVFSAAYGAFFRGEYKISGTQNPLLGQVAVRVVDARGRITGIERIENQLVISLEGEDLYETTLEFNSSEVRNIQTISRSGDYCFNIPEGQIPGDAWIWLKKGKDWLDFGTAEGSVDI